MPLVRMSPVEDRGQDVGPRGIMHYSISRSVDEAVHDGGVKNRVENQEATRFCARHHVCS